MVRKSFQTTQKVLSRVGLKAWKIPKTGHTVQSFPWEQQYDALMQFTLPERQCISQTHLEQLQYHFRILLTG